MSATSVGARSYWPSSQWYSTTTFCPSTLPVSLKPLRERSRIARGGICRPAVEKSDHRHRRLLPPRALHLDSEQQAAAPDQGNELTPFEVEHGHFLPDALSESPTGPCPVFRSFSLPPRGWQVLGVDLNCSESRRRRPAPHVPLTPPGWHPPHSCA